MYEAAAAIPKPIAPPKVAMRMPVMDGLIMRPACHGMAPSAIALEPLPRDERGISAMRLGSSKARKVRRLSAARIIRCSTRAEPEDR